MIKINDKYCLSFKSKKEKIQCSRLKKEGCNYCGIHLRSKKIENINEHNNIIKIQKVFKGWEKRRRFKSLNKEDFATLENIFDIPIQYYFQYKDDDGFIYSFDKRTLKLIFEKNPINPYNGRRFPFPLPKINGFYKKPTLTEEQKYYDYLVQTFLKIDNLGHYTDISWLDDLELNELKKFYKDANDIFNYRAELNTETKKKIVKKGILFQSLLHKLKNIYDKNKLRMEILREINKIYNEGINDEYKKLGFNLILTVFVEINSNAALALPHLVQSTFDSI